MAENITPVPVKIPMIDRSGLLSMTWENWFRQLFARIGGSVALTNAELEADISALQTTSASHTTSIATINTTLNDILQGRQL